MTDKYLKKRAAQGEVVGGGFIVIRRGDGSGRFRAKVADGFLTPFEYSTREAAEARARHMASLPNAKGTYCVLQQITAIPSGNGAGGDKERTDGKTKDREESRKEGSEEGNGENRQAEMTSGQASPTRA